MIEILSAVFQPGEPSCIDRHYNNILMVLNKNVQFNFFFNYDK